MQEFIILCLFQEPQGILTYLSLAEDNLYMWPDLPEGVLYVHSFKTHFYHIWKMSTDQHHMSVKVKQSAFTQASFSSLSDICECSGGL